MRQISIACFIVLLGYTALSQGQCPAGDIQDPSTGECYTFFDSDNDRRSFQDARNTCQQRGGELFMPTTPQSMSFIRQRMIAGLPDRYWLGLREVHHQWKWTDGSYMTNQGCYDRQRLSTQFSPISIQNPNPITCSEACANQGQSWAAVRYVRSQSREECLCSSQDFSPPIDSIVTDCNRVCPGYEDYYDERAALQLRCGSEAQNANSEDHMWIFYAHGDEPFNPWKRNQPNSYDNYQSCLALVDPNKRFSDETCNLRENMGHICQYDSGSCLNGQITVGGNCVSFHPTSSFDWFEANKDCKNRGGRLAKIEDFNYWAAITVTSQIQQASKWWIGGYFSTWQLVNGAMVEHTEWATLQPDQRTEVCATAYRNANSGNQNTLFLWDDHDCNQQYNFICQSSAAPTTPSTTTTTTTTTSTTTTKPVTTPSTITTTMKSQTTPRSTASPTTTATTATTTATTTAPNKTPTASPTEPPPYTPTASSTDSPTTTEATGGSTGGSTGNWLDEEHIGSIIAIVIASVAVLAGFIRLMVFCCQRKTGEDTQKLDA